ncbi:HAUS augmin-like complex subunit 2 [Aulostomus maculatus]
MNMLRWDIVSPFTVTPAASLLSKCVSSGLLSQEEIDSTSCGQSSAFSSDLFEVEQRIRMQKQFDELQLEVELLKVEKQSAAVTHPFCLTQRTESLQGFCSHLQDVLKDQSRLRQRLMRPLGRADLPVQAHLHRFVVDVVKMAVDLIEMLEEKMSATRNRPAATDQLAQLNQSLSQLLVCVSEVEMSVCQVLEWKEVSSSLLGDSSP